MHWFTKNYLVEYTIKDEDVKSNWKRKRATRNSVYEMKQLYFILITVPDSLF